MLHSVKLLKKVSGWNDYWVILGWRQHPQWFGKTTKEPSESQRILWTTSRLNTNIHYHYISACVNGQIELQYCATTDTRVEILRSNWLNRSLNILGEILNFSLFKIGFIEWLDSPAECRTLPGQRKVWKHAKKGVPVKTMLKRKNGNCEKEF